jgi:O-succinylbenzoate synthase
MMIRIEEVILHHISMQLKAPFETSFGVESDRQCLIVEAHSEGLTGWGECVAGELPGYSYETADTAWQVLSQCFIPGVLGRYLESAGQLQQALAAFRGHPMARAGLEMALWDLAGKLGQVSLASMLGGTRLRVPVGVSIGIMPDAHVLLQRVEGYLKAGYRRIKLKIKPGRDVEEVRVIRQAYHDLALQVDANSSYRLDQSQVFMHLDRFGLLLIEQPLADDDLVDHSRLQAQLRTPICLDESILSARHARQALELDSCRAINIKAGRVGGLSEAVAVHDLCLDYHVPVWCGGMLETGVGRASNLALASLPGFVLPGDISASERYYSRDIAEPAFMLNDDSTIDVPQGMGLGVVVDRRALRKFTLRCSRQRASGRSIRRRF